MTTSETSTGYVGRFAPTPSGPLHFGSLIAALASYLDARRNNGRWLLRIDDIDTPRVRAGAADRIRRTLEAFGLHWDGEIIFQSHRRGTYEAALASLMEQERLYRCDCPRRLTKGKPYPGTCRNRRIPADTPRCSLRVRTIDEPVSLRDHIQGDYSQTLGKESGDFVVHRSDGITAYHLATAIDDGSQGITHVVRGADLLPSTPSQVYLQRLLKLPTPVYAHFPVAVDPGGHKISKSDQAPAVDIEHRPAEALFSALAFLGHTPPAELNNAPTPEILEWAVQHWDLAGIPKQMETPLPQSWPG